MQNDDTLFTEVTLFQQSEEESSETKGTESDTNEKARLKSLTQDMIKYQKAYDYGEPLITDQEYDQLYKELLQLEQKHGALPNSPTNTVGYNISNEENIKHLTPMLSLEHQIIKNNNTEECISFFLKKINRFLNTDQFYTLTFEPKIDGVSVSIRYVDGKIHSAALRGDGKEGENILANILKIPSIPKQISIKDTIEIRGELYITNETFQKLSQEQIFASARHAVAGSVRLLDPEEFKKRNIKIFCHGFSSLTYDFSKTQYSDFYDLLQKEGFTMAPMQIAKTLDEAIKLFNNLNDQRRDMDYILDGGVFKIDDMSLHTKLSHSSKAPRYAFAIKFESLIYKSKITNIDWQLGRTGVLTPVVEIEPTITDGSTTTYLTMHNASEFLNHKPYKNSTILFEKAGDVIPKIIQILPPENQSNNTDTQAYSLPTNCPSCNTSTQQDDKFLFCPNTNWSEHKEEMCKQQVIARLIHLISRDGLDIEGLAIKKIEFFYDMNVLIYPKDIYHFFDNCDEMQIQLHTLPGFGSKSTTNLLEQIEKAKKLPFNRVLYSLGIPGLGKSLANKISQQCKNWEEFENWLPLSHEIDGIGDIMKEKMLNFINLNRKYILDLLSHIEIVEQKQNSIQKNNIKIVFTGKFENFSRQAMKVQAEQKGYTVQEAVNSQTKYLIAGEASGSKLKKAQELNIEILDESTWFEIMKN